MNWFQRLVIDEDVRFAMLASMLIGMIVFCGAMAVKEYQNIQLRNSAAITIYLDNDEKLINVMYNKHNSKTLNYLVQCSDGSYVVRKMRSNNIYFSDLSEVKFKYK